MRYIWKIRLIRISLLTSFLTLIYFLVWNLIIRLDLLSFSSSSVGNFTISGEMAQVSAKTSIEVVLWRLWFIPIYWSHIGFLLKYHYISIILIFIFSIVLSWGVKVEQMEKN